MSEKLNEIISCIDKHLEQTGKEFLTPPEANKLLEKHNILEDSDTRSGLPLRKLLRDNAIKHAYKIGRYWYIPHSKQQ